MDPSTVPELEAFAPRYVWWQAPAEALTFPARVIARVMDIGDWEALGYFQGGDLATLSDSERRQLLRDVRDVRDLPRVSLASPRLDG